MDFERGEIPRTKHNRGTSDDFFGFYGLERSANKPVGNAVLPVERGLSFQIHTDVHDALR